MIRVHLTLFAVALFYGIMFSLAGEIMPHYLTPEGFVWMRVAFAALCFQLLALALPKEPIDWKAHGWELALCGFLGTSANMYLFFKGLALTKPINGAVLMLVTPLAVALLDHWRLRQGMRAGFVVGLLMACVGALMLMTGANSAELFDSSHWKGDVYVAINALLYAFYLVRVKQLTPHYQANTINRISFGLGLAYMSLYALAHWWLTDMSITTQSGQRSSFSLAFLGPDTAHMPNTIFWKIAYTLVFVSFLVYLLNTYAVKKAGPTLAGIYIYLQPVLATAIALFLGRDELSWTKSACMVLVLIGVWIAKENSPSVLRNRLSSQQN